MSSDDADELVASVVSAYMDYLEALDGLADDTRTVAVEVISLIDLLREMGDVDRYGEAPSFRELLAGTEFDDGWNR